MAERHQADAAGEHPGFAEQHRDGRMDGWSCLTEVAKDKRLVLDTFGVGPTKGMIECRCQRAAQGPHRCNKIALGMQSSV